MFKIIEEHPTRLEKEFKALKKEIKEMQKIIVSTFFGILSIAVMWPIVLFATIIDVTYSIVIVIIIAGIVILSGMNTAIFFKTSFRKSCSSKMKEE